MPHLSLQLSPQGPLLDVFVGVSAPRRQALTAAGLPVPPPIVVRALIDTGASISGVDPAHLTTLAIPPSGSTLLQTPSTAATPHPCNTFDVGVYLPHQGTVRQWDPIAVVGVTLLIQGIGMLIGRDMLQRCLLVYDGGAGLFMLGI